MFKAKIRINHQECWSQSIAKIYHKKFHQYHTASLTKKTTSDIFFIQASQKEQKEILKFIKKEKKITEFEIIEQTPTTLLVLIVTKVKNSIIERVIKNKCFILDTGNIYNGAEEWLIRSSNKENITNLLEDLQEVGIATLISITPYFFDRGSLTEKQKECLRVAYKEGYYNWPRNITTQQLAKLLKIGKSTYVEHLRKAEEKLVKEFLEKH